MTEPINEERRRHPRVAPEQAARLLVPVVYDVEVIDISQSGVLFWCRRPLHSGQRAQIRAVLDGEPFTAGIEIVRTENHAGLAASARKQRFGAKLVAIDDNSKRNLQRFLVLAR